MRDIVLIAAAVMVVGGYVARVADQETTAHPPHVASHVAPRAAAVQLAASETSDYGRSLTLDANRQGHFRTDARVNGSRMGFMVDTGASLVVLRASSAAEAGIHPMPADYTATVSTANGKIKAAPAKLERIEIGNITVFDVPALVLPDKALAENLLGVSFLSRLKSYAVADGHMVLEQ
jgi:aspartyl protease family protein